MKYTLLLIAITIATHSFSQIDTAFINRVKLIESSNTLQTDTAAVPEDALTAKIREMRAVRKGLNAQTVIQLKIKEEQAKDTTRPAAFYDALLKEMTTGRTAQLMENSMINLYRQQFSTTDVDDMIKFYKTPAGQKMDAVFYLIIIRSMKDADQLLKMAGQKLGAGK